MTSPLGNIQWRWASTALISCCNSRFLNASCFSHHGCSIHITHLSNRVSCSHLEAWDRVSFFETFEHTRALLVVRGRAFDLLFFPKYRVSIHFFKHFFSSMSMTLFWVMPGWEFQLVVPQCGEMDTQQKRTTMTMKDFVVDLGWLLTLHILNIGDEINKSHNKNIWHCSSSKTA